MPPDKGERRGKKNSRVAAGSTEAGEGDMVIYLYIKYWYCSAVQR